jgi:hypothetical protein
MKRNVSISQVLARPLPPPGDLAYGTLGLGMQHYLVRMLVNSLEWAARSVSLVIFAT